MVNFFFCEFHLTAKNNYKQMKLKVFIMVITLALPAFLLTAQDKAAPWSLTECIDYALKNNIDVQKNKIAVASRAVDTKQARAAYLPNLSGSVSQDVGTHLFVNGNSYSGSYGLSSSMPLFDGGKISNNVKQSRLQEQVNQLSVESSERDLKSSILEAYLKILYADEAVKVNQSMVEASQYQKTRGESLLKAGSISPSDYAQLVSQLSTDKYNLALAESTLSTYKLALKQLLELGVTDKVNISAPELTDDLIMKPLGSLESVYENTLKVKPGIRSYQINNQIAALQTSNAKTGYSPTVSMNGSVNAANNSINNLGTDLKNSANANVGISVSIPISDRRVTKSAVEKAKLNEKSVDLALKDAEKSLLKEVESVYQDALSAQSQYLSAKENVAALESSYNLLQKQYQLGMKNTLELITAKNNLLSARQSLLQAKYTSIMNVQLLNLYQDVPLEIK